ncbi:MAG: SIR2 family protein [Pseudomonadota bacterium]
MDIEQIIPNYTVADIAKKISKIIEPGNCVAWIGSGFTKLAGYPSLYKLVMNLIDSCYSNNSKSAKDLKKQLDDKILTEYEIAEKCFDSGKNQKKYYECLEKQFEKNNITREGITTLAKLPFKAYITTNYDSKLPNAIDVELSYNAKVFVGKQSKYSEISKHTKPVFCIHGLVDFKSIGDPKTIVLKESDFSRGYEDIKTFIKDVLIKEQVVFLGCKLEESIMREIFNEIDEVPKKKKFCILSKTSENDAEIALLKNSPDIKIDEKSDEEKQKLINEQRKIMDKNHAKRFDKINAITFAYEPEKPSYHDEIETLLELINRNCLDKVRIKQKELIV